MSPIPDGILSPISGTYCETTSVLFVVANFGSTILLRYWIWKCKSHLTACVLNICRISLTSDNHVAYANFLLLAGRDSIIKLSIKWSSIKKMLWAEHSKRWTCDRACDTTICLWYVIRQCPRVFLVVQYEHILLWVITTTSLLSSSSLWDLINTSVGPFACRKESIIETMLLKHKRSKLVLSLIETPGFGPSSMGTDW